MQTQRHFVVLFACAAGCFGQSSSSDLPHFGVQVSAGTLGAGIQAATAVTKRSNVRFGFNYFTYSGTTSKSNIDYDGTLRLMSGEVLYDQYLVGGLHISPGVAIYDGNQATGNAAVAGGHTFSLNDVSYYSATSDPVKGTAAVTSRKISPELLIGFGNLLPRSSRHFTLNFDIGVIFQGSPNAKLNFNGSTCPSNPTTGCSAISGNSSVQSNIQAEEGKINHDLLPFKYYPVIRMGLGYRF